MTADFQRKSLDDIVSEEKPETTEQIKPETPEIATEEDGDDVATDANGQKQVPLAALQKSRRTAKEREEAWERRYREREEASERRFAELIERVIPKQEPQPPPDPFTDFDGAINHKIAPLQEHVTGVGMDAVRLASEARAMASHGTETYRKMEASLQEAINNLGMNHPEMQQLAVTLARSRDPASVAMAWYEQRPEVIREKIRAEYMAELQEQGFVPPQAKQPPGAPVMPSNLNGARNVGTRSGPKWAGPTPLADIFKR